MRACQCPPWLALSSPRSSRSSRSVSQPYSSMPLGPKVARRSLRQLGNTLREDVSCPRFGITTPRATVRVHWWITAASSMRCLVDSSAVKKNLPARSASCFVKTAVRRYSRGRGLVFVDHVCVCSFPAKPDADLPCRRSEPVRCHIKPASSPSPPTQSCISVNPGLTVSR